ncbi:Gfo/Idh/MocA family protein [Limnoglobus roseus]|uniref:Putative Rossmann-fold-type glycoside hydrolase n=1 Tax=Limnoglobus roseus TaxID=2598579 RepID=A0A5C1A817_9BACT|nr:Gfo/Idh/MocA family oxidoreductase [Limnoglobus roseus]QEL13274.1 putative Rossmann-fold-type glycoside hydrolase [Limnoglobus roseus]
MSTKLSEEDKRVGAYNFNQAAADIAANNPDRRTFMKAVTAAGAVLPVSAAVYFGYDSWKGNKAVKAAIIGVGDEGGVLIGEHNPEYLQFVATCDLRPSNQKRILEGEPNGPRKGFNKIYGKDVAAKIKQFSDYKQLISEAKSLGIEAVVIATPLFTHKDIAVECMNAGLHVLCEKLMARDVKSCKEMIASAKKNGVLLSVGHQRHYSLLYAHALEVVNSGILGDIKHIRAQWPRNNSWPFVPTEAQLKTFATGKDIDGKEFDIPALIDGWCKPVPKEDAEPFLKDPDALLKKTGFKSITELVRWRLYDRTGGGLMAELGSHQLDATSIFLGKVHPLSVSGVGGKFFYGKGKNDRESNDGVFTTFEFPGPNHPKGKNKGTDESDVVVMTYTSFNTNEFEDYGECLMGSRGTMIVEKEANVYLYKEKEKGPAAKKDDKGGKDTLVKVTGEGSKKPAMEAASTWGGGGASIAKAAGGPAWDTEIRGYRTEMEHFAYCIRRWQDLKQPVSYEKNSDGTMKHKDILPRCHGEVAMADAILALTANMAMAKKQRIEFEHGWFDAESPDAPEPKYG